MTKQKTIGNLARELIEARYDNETVAKIVREQIPEAKLSAKGVSAIRWQMRKEGLDVLTSLQNAGAETRRGD